MAGFQLAVAANTPLLGHLQPRWAPRAVYNCLLRTGLIFTTS
jgi:hypothetical protein